jgi:isoleucyl-tRNA synthetase
VYRKVRNTARYLLGNLHDFNPLPTSKGGDAVPIAELPLLDRWMLMRTAELIKEVTEYFPDHSGASPEKEKGKGKGKEREKRFTFEPYRFAQALQNFCVVDLSNFYLDIAKDRLYVSGKNDFRRRSCQTVLSLVVENLAVLMAPVLCHLAEDIWQNLPYKVAERSVFERGWPDAPAEWKKGLSFEEKSAIKDVRDVLRPTVNRLLESCRRKQVGVTHSIGDGIGSSLELNIQLGEPDANSSLQNLQAVLAASPFPNVDNLADWLLVSALRVGGEAPSRVLAQSEEVGLKVSISRADGHKCERCWHYTTDIGQHASHPTLCGRCSTVVEDE